jgi:hypothetical protein
MNLSDDNERAEYEAARAQRMVDKARKTSTILALQVQDGSGWTPAVDGCRGVDNTDPDRNPSLNTPSASRGTSEAPSMEALLGTLNGLYTKIGAALSLLGNHVQKARVNPSGSTPARPFPNTGSTGTKNALSEHERKMLLDDALFRHQRRWNESPQDFANRLKDTLDELERDRNHLRR